MRHVVSELDSLHATKVLIVNWEVHGQGPIFDSLHTDPDARTELFQLFGEDVSFGSLIVDHRVEAVIAESDDKDHDLDEHPVAAGLLRRIDAAHSLVDQVVSDKQTSDSAEFVERLKFMASRTDDAQVRVHAQRVVARWFTNGGDK
jgi:hypothetical protein